MHRERPLFAYRSEDQRAWFRVRPPESDPLIVRIGDEEARVLDISAGGISYQGQGQAAGDRRQAHLHLPDGMAPMEATLEILGPKTPGILRARFVAPPAESVERLHRYVLNVQKAARRREKAGAQPTGGAPPGISKD
jgi:hypothetical protein